MSRRSITVALGAGLVTVLLTACGPVAGTPGASSSSAAAVTAGPSGGPTSAGPAAPTYPNSADAYAKAAVVAWQTGDTTRLGQLDDPGDTVFGTLNGGNYNKAFALYRCDGAAGSSICTFYNSVGDDLDLRLRNDLVGQPHAVVDGHFNPITFPTDYQAYAQEALNDWIGHNTAAVALLTGKPSDTAFSHIPASARDTSWTFQSEQGAAGHEYFVFTDPQNNSIAIGFVNPTIQSPPANHHGLIEDVEYSVHP